MEQILSFNDVVLYRRGIFGISRTDCKVLNLATGQKYAQYDDAVRYQLVEKGKRKPQAYALADHDPWMVVVKAEHAIQPDSGLVEDCGSKSSRYPSCDPRWVTDFEEKLMAARPAVVVLWSVGLGRAVSV